MPIAKITKGKDAAGCLNYVLKKEKAQIIETNCLSNEPDVLADEFGMADDAQNQTSKGRKASRKVHHASIGLPIGLELKPNEWSAITKDYLKGMGFDPDQNQYVAAIHRDTDHQHLHLVVNRVRLDGVTTDNAWKDWQRAEDVMRKLEKDYDLPAVTPSRDAQVKAPTVAEVRQSRATGQPILRQEMQQSIELAARSVKSLPELQRTLKEVGIELTIRYRVPVNDGNVDTTTPRLNLLFTSTQESSGKEITFSASSLGKRYTAKGLQHNFGLGLEEGEQIGDAVTQEAIGVSVEALIVTGASEPLAVLDEEKELQEEKSGEGELKQGEKTTAELEAENQKQFYQKLWTQIQRDVLKAGIPKEQVVPAVAVVALGRTFTHQQVAAIVAQSPEAKRKLKEKGRAELNQYLQTVVNQAEVSYRSGRGVRGTAKDEGR